jgi:cell division inhibitor SulA/protein ImuA
MANSCEFARLLEHPGLWRAISTARTEVLPTGFEALDERLPGKGWPRSGLIEILLSRFGVGELFLLLPALATLTRRPMARWCVWVAPPFEPFAPALAAQGVALERMLIVGRPVACERPSQDAIAEPLWAFEQSLGSGACDVAMAWARKRPTPREIRRLQLAAERGRTLGVLFRPQRAEQEASHAMLRMRLEPIAHGVRITLLKGRGGVRGSVELALRAPKS